MHHYNLHLTFKSTSLSLIKKVFNELGAIVPGILRSLESDAPSSRFLSQWNIPFGPETKRRAKIMLLQNQI